MASEHILYNGKEIKEEHAGQLKANLTFKKLDLLAFVRHQNGKSTEIEYQGIKWAKNSYYPFSASANVQVFNKEDSRVLEDNGYRQVIREKGPCLAYSFGTFPSCCGSLMVNGFSFYPGDIDNGTLRKFLETIPVLARAMGYSEVVFYQIIKKDYLYRNVPLFNIDVPELSPVSTFVNGRTNNKVGLYKIDPKVFSFLKVEDDRTAVLDAWDKSSFTL